MGFMFGRHRDRHSVQMTTSPSVKRPGWLRGLFSRDKGRQLQSPLTDTSSVASSVRSNVPTPSVPSRNDLDLAGPSTAMSLWDRAYKALGEQSPDLTEKYEYLLIQASTPESDEDVPPRIATSGHDIQFDRTRLLEIGEKGIAATKENRTAFHIGKLQFSPKEQIANVAEVALKIKELVAEAVKASPEASIAWSGVCLVLPLLTNPITAEADNHDGFIYVTARMRYYTGLEPLVESLGKGFENVLPRVYDFIVVLYQSILDFQIRSVLRYHQHGLKRYAKDVVGSEDWDKKVEDIKTLEATVERNLRQINELEVIQKLKSLDQKATAFLDTFQELPGLTRQQLEVMKDQRDLMHKQLSLQQDEHARHLSDKEERCRQLFRLTSSERDATYEWYKDREEDWVEGTCQWFLNHEDFKEWSSQESGMLLVSADPGCGKSVLAKYLIDHVLQPATVCYFFFKDQDQNTVRQMLCALLHQLFCQKPSLIKHAMAEYSSNGDGLVNTTASLWKIFDATVRDPQAGAIVVVLDALDECVDTEFAELVRQLELQLRGDTTRSHRLKLLMTSRPYDQIVSEFRELFKAVPNVHIPGEERSEAISQEVNLVIEHRVKALELEPSLAIHLAKKLHEIPHRTYLWVYFVFNELKSNGFKKTFKGVDSMIKTLPQNVNEAYEQILKKSKDPEGAKTALAIILAAQRPLTLSEMNVAMNMEKDTQTFSDIDLEKDDDFQKTLRSCCGLFVSIHHGKVYFLHQTAREFLQANASESTGTQSTLHWHQSISIHKAHAVLAEKCVLYLALFNSSEYGHESSNNSFLDYSATYWPLHFREAPILDDTLSFPIARDICEPDSASYSMWFTIYCRNNSRWIDLSSPSNLVLSSYLGLATIVERILATQKVDPNAHSEDSHTALSLAASEGHEAVVKLLLACENIDINREDDSGNTPLTWAASEGHEAVVGLLSASKNVDINRKNHIGLTPLYCAAGRGHEAVVRTLLTAENIDVNAKDRDARTPLFWAARNGREDIVKLLLAAENIDVNTKDKRGNTLLSWAIDNRYGAVVRLLLAADNIDINAKDVKGSTPLASAAFHGDEAAVKLLLATEKIDINSKDKYNRTPLLLAVDCGHEAIVRLLLATNKVDIDSKDNDGQTPLSRAAENGHEAVIRLLLATKKVDVDMKDSNGYTPLHRAATYGHEAVVKLLLATKKVDIEMKANNGCTPLHQAATYGHEAVVKLLLATKKVDIKMKDNHGNTPLHQAATYGHEAVVKLLLATKKVDIKMKDNHGNTPLHQAATHGHEAVVKLLLATKKVDIEMKDKYGFTPLHWAAACGHKAIVSLLGPDQKSSQLLSPE